MFNAGLKILALSVWGLALPFLPISEFVFNVWKKLVLRLQSDGLSWFLKNCFNGRFKSLSSKNFVKYDERKSKAFLSLRAIYLNNSIFSLFILNFQLCLLFEFPTKSFIVSAQLEFSFLPSIILAKYNALRFWGMNLLYSAFAVMFSGDGLENNALTLSTKYLESVTSLPVNSFSYLSSSILDFPFLIYWGGLEGSSSHSRIHSAVKANVSTWTFWSSIYLSCNSLISNVNSARCSRISLSINYAFAFGIVHVLSLEET